MEDSAAAPPLVEKPEDPSTARLLAHSRVSRLAKVRERRATDQANADLASASSLTHVVMDTMTTAKQRELAGQYCPVIVHQPLPKRLMLHAARHRREWCWCVSTVSCCVEASSTTHELCAAFRGCLCARYDRGSAPPLAGYVVTAVSQA
jgi:hypothetical protein